MITIYNENFNSNRKINHYYEYTAQLNTSKLHCPKCNHVGGCERHAYYRRFFIYNNQKYELSILRVRCKHCNTTHALLPFFLLPYFQIPLVDVIQILNLSSKDQYHRFLYDHCLLEESHIYHIKKRFQDFRYRTIQKEIYLKMVNHLKLMIHFILFPLPTYLS